MSFDWILPLSMTMGIIVYALIIKWYVLPHAMRQSRRDALTPHLLLHSMRYVGLAFLVPGVTAGPLDPRFSHPAAFGDVAVAMLALVTLLALRRGWALATPLLWVFNVFGLADLLNAVVTGLILQQFTFLGATYFIPVMIVPALLVSHATIFALLVRREAAGSEPTLSAPIPRSSESH